MKTLKKNLLPLARVAGIPVACLVVLTGCQSQPEQSVDLLASNDYRLRHPIMVTEQPEVLDLPIGYHTRNLNRHLSAAITSFAIKSRSDGNGRVEVLVPAGAANEAAVHSVIPEIRTALRQGGLKKNHISLRSYSVTDGSANAPIRLSFARVMASAGECGEWPSNVGGSFNRNTDYENFGCATQANLAAVVANPADLLTPRATTPADQQRRAVVYENYRNGKVTASEYKEGAGAKVAE